jgi:hypothetical protein
MLTGYSMANMPEYYWQKPHYNFFNKILHSDMYKKLNPIRSRYDWNGDNYTQHATFFGVYPTESWVYGSLDYTFSKYHRHYQAHDEWYPDRKNKSLGFTSGGLCDKTLRVPKYMGIQYDMIPRGCHREITKYQSCAAEKGNDACFNEKISIMEVCPDHVLEGLREKRKENLRSQAIDNQTYRRAMEISDYNRSRSLTDFEQKTWKDGSATNLRSESIWQDDRYDPRKYPHPHRYDNVNFPEQEYTDIFGGTRGLGAIEEQKKHQIGFLDGKSNKIREVAKASTLQPKSSPIKEALAAVTENIAERED